MKQFFEQYGAIALGILALLVLIAMITPVGNIIKTSLQGTSHKFATSMNGQLDAAMESSNKAQMSATDIMEQYITEFKGTRSTDREGYYRTSGRTSTVQTDILENGMPTFRSDTVEYVLVTVRPDGSAIEDYYAVGGSFDGKLLSHIEYNNGYSDDEEGNTVTLKRVVYGYKSSGYRIKTDNNFTGNKNEDVKVSEAYYDNSGNMIKQYLYSYYEDGTTRKTKIKDNPADGYFTHEYLEEYDRSGNYHKTFYNPDGSVNEIKCYNSSNTSIACSAVNL